MKFINGDFKVEWEWIGEGMGGDYNKDNPDDEPLLRFYCYKKFGKEWEEIWNTSYCTHVKQGTPRVILQSLSKLIFAVLERCEVLDVGDGAPEYEASGELERELQKLSWMEA